MTKLNTQGSGLVYSSFLGGSDWDVATGIAVDASGAAYVAGGTNSTDFPTTAGAFQTTCGNTGGFSDAYVTEVRRHRLGPPVFEQGYLRRQHRRPGTA